MALKLTDKVAVLIENSGGKFDYFPVTDFNELISTEESERLDVIEAQIGDYDPSETDSTIAEDLVDHGNRIALLESANQIVVIDASEETGDVQLIAEPHIAVLTDNAAEAVDLVLPEAVVNLVGVRITVSNQDDAAVDVAPTGTDTINGVNSAETIAITESVTFVCYAAGKWALI